ncbi:MAG: hypothetical protein ISS93_01710 [Candidatus Aenigmarchaeota archaeon]|nr:hypothetical protein [Candidatus Aenigmarchaeota archaeon]
MKARAPGGFSRAGWRGDYLSGSPIALDEGSIPSPAATRFTAGAPLPCHTRRGCPLPSGGIRIEFGNLFLLLDFFELSWRGAGTDIIDPSSKSPFKDSKPNREHLTLFPLIRFPQSFFLVLDFQYNFYMNLIPTTRIGSLDPRREMSLRPRERPPRTKAKQDMGGLSFSLVN